MPNATRLTHDQIRRVLTPTPGGRKDEFICPVCEHGHLLLFGDNGFDCKNDCDDSTVAKKLHELVGNGDRPVPEEPPTGLTLQQYCNMKILPLGWLVLHYGDLTNPTPMAMSYKGKPAVAFAYMDADRNTVFTRFRTSVDTKPRSEHGSKMTIPYGLWLARNKADAKGQWPRSVILCEGESDQQTLTLHGFSALGIPGSQSWKSEWANIPVIKYAEKVFIIQEPGDAGKKFVETISQDLRAKAVPLKFTEYKDPSELHIGLVTRREVFDDKTTFGDALVAIAKASGSEKDARRIQSILASSVEMALTKWLWFNHIPISEVTVFAGMPGKGKSTVGVDVVARLTNGKDFPDSVKQVEACEVAILASEDNHRTTTVPRLRAAGADVSRVHLIQGTSDGNQEWEIALDVDLDRLKNFLREHAAIRLIVIDPVTSYIGEVDPNKPKEVRPFLNKLKKFAEEMNVGILLIMHLSKNLDVSALHRVGGAATWIEVPRSVWFFDEKKQDEDEDKNIKPPYVMVNGKLNIVADERKKSLEYTFASVDVEIKGFQQSMGTIQWGGECDVTLEQQYSRVKEKPGPEPKRVEAAADWLREYLADGEKFAAEVFKAADLVGHAEKTLRKAQERLGIKPEREFANKGRWVWRLPDALS